LVFTAWPGKWLQSQDLYFGEALFGYFKIPKP